MIWIMLNVKKIEKCLDKIVFIEFYLDNMAENNIIELQLTFFVEQFVRNGDFT